MIIQKQGYEILNDISEGGEKELRLIEQIARVCYKSVPKTGEFEETKDFIRRLMKRKHEAMLEHSMLSVKFTCDRGISHEIVRHRLASFAQESTRWCNYGKERFGKEITVIEPPFLGDDEKTRTWNRVCWRRQCEEAEKIYMYLLDRKEPPQIARSVLPTCLKTEVVMTANYREWRHFFELRTAKDAHPQIRELATQLLIELNDKIPVIFEDLAKKVQKEADNNV